MVFAMTTVQHSLTALTTAVESALTHFQQHPKEVKQLMGTYLDEVVTLACAA